MLNKVTNFTKVQKRELKSGNKHYTGAVSKKAAPVIFFNPISISFVNQPTPISKAPLVTFRL